MPGLALREKASGSLSMRITGIAFWGMTLSGLLISLMAMRSWDQNLDTRFAMHLAKAENLVRDELARHPEMLMIRGRMPDEAFLEQTIRQERLSGLRIAWRTGYFQLGMVDQGAPVIRDIFVADDAHLTEPVRLEFFQPAKARLISDRHKNILVFTGLVAMVFGFVLQFILRRILTDPFNRMVESAKQIARGNKSVRFQDGGSGEFAFLSGFINQAIDVAHESEVALSREKERVEVTLKSISDAVIATDSEGRVQFMNPIAESLSGYRTADVQGKPISLILGFLDELSREYIKDPVDACLSSGTTIKLDAGSELLVNKAGIEIPVSGTASLMLGTHGEKIGCVIALQDVRESREMMHRLFQQANRDSLTGLFNRQSFESQLRSLIEDRDPSGQCHALLYLDLDQFKVVNDTGGHVAGDELLRQLSDILHGSKRHDDILARLGGDEFGMLLKRCDARNAARVADKLRRSVEEFRFMWGDNVFQVGVSIGLVPFVSGSTSLGEVLSQADMACYAAKEAGRNRIHVYAQTDDELSARQTEMRWISYLNRAIDENLFELYLQSIVSLDPQDTHRHWEVLLRLRMEDGLVSPGAFMPAAERFGLMTKIDRWVITRTLQCFARSNGQLLGPNEFFAINLSGASLGDASLTDFVKGVQAATGVPWRAICFEVTETVAIRNLAVGKSFIEEMRGLGCRFSLDDFGSGLSSFAYLKNLDVDYLKIDGAFIRDLKNDPVDRAMVEAILQVGRIMGIKTIAEWVESEEIADILRGMGIDYGQGYYFGEPASIQSHFSGKPPLALVRKGEGQRRLA